MLGVVADSCVVAGARLNFAVDALQPARSALQIGKPHGLELLWGVGRYGIITACRNCPALRD